ncbi:MAG: hypothetical protein DHS20C20_22390 [Ardenticatenaceae bacterium]|nr:MAG: hypothetical protein DHS20C20_22390 [Ardenticatenaceae bacterium]
MSNPRFSPPTYIAEKVLHADSLPIETESTLAVKPIAKTKVDWLPSLSLPSDIVEVLKKPLQELGSKLEAIQTTHPYEPRKIEHHCISSPIGRKLVVLFLKKEVVDNPGPLYSSQFFAIGDLFAEKYHSIFVLSDAEKMTPTYKDILRTWRNKPYFDNVDSFENEEIQGLQNSEIDIVIGKIKNWFDLSELADAPEHIEEERSINRTKLRKLIENNFDLAGLRTLCFDLEKDHGLKYENLKGEGLGDKVIALIQYFENRNSLPALLDYCKDARDNTPWDEVEEIVT